MWNSVSANSAKSLSPYILNHSVAQLLFWSAFYYLMPAISAQISTEMGWPVLHISVSYTLAFLVWSACAPFVGMSIDRGWGGYVMRAGGFCGALILVGLALVSDRWMFSGLLALLGVCMATVLYDPCFALVMRKLGERGSEATATITLIAGFATLLTFPLAQWLSHILSWQHIMLVFAALPLLAAFMLPAQDRMHEKETDRTAPPPYRIEKAPVLISLAFGLTMMGHAILLFLLPVVLIRDGDVGAVGLLAVAILGPAQIAGRLAWRVWGSAYAPKHSAPLLFCVFCLPALILLLVGPRVGFVYAALIIQGACYGIHTIMRPTLARFYLPNQHFGRGLGQIAAVGLLMMALGPALGGLVWNYFGFSGLMVCIFGLNAVALGLIFVLFQTKPVELAS